MTVSELQNKLGLEVVTMPEPDREVTGGYCGDLLSWVMGRAQSGDMWVTIMTNLNIVAVATMSDAACIVLAEGVTVDDGVVEKAELHGVNILRSERSAYSLCNEQILL